MILFANPSTIAVFPVPGSPTKIGLFFDLLDKICNNLLISSSLPITGSNLPSLAFDVRLIAYFSREFKLVSSDDDFTFSPFLIFTKIFFTLSRLYPNPIKIFDNSLLESINEINK